MRLKEESAVLKFGESTIFGWQRVQSRVLGVLEADPAGSICNLSIRLARPTMGVRNLAGFNAERIEAYAAAPSFRTQLDARLFMSDNFDMPRRMLIANPGLNPIFVAIRITCIELVRNSSSAYLSFVAERLDPVAMKE